MEASRLRNCLLTAIVILISSATAQRSVQAQDSPAASDSLELVALGAEAGEEAGRVASVTGARWGSAAVTFFLTPFLGGVGSLVSAQVKKGYPADVPMIAPEAEHPAFQEGYREGYRSTYTPRYRRAVRTSVIATTIVFFVGAAAFAG